MAILTTGNTFSTGQQVTAASLNAQVNASSFVDGAIDVATMRFLQTSPTKEQIGVKDLGISTVKIAELAVTGAKIAEATIAPSKLSAGAPSWNSTQVVIPNSLNHNPVTTAASGTYGRAATTGLVTVTMTAHGMVTGNIVLLDFSENAGVAATDGFYSITRVNDNSFTVVDTVASPTAIAVGTAVSRTYYYGNVTFGAALTIGGNTFVSQNLNVNKNVGISGLLSVSNSVSVPEGVLKPIVRTTELVTTSGTFIDFTSIPSWAKRITILFNGVRANGTNNFLIQLIDSDGVEDSGYVSTSSGASSDVTSTSGFVVTAQSVTSGTSAHGRVTINNFNSSNLWISSGVIGTTRVLTSVGSKTLSSTLTGVRITTTATPVAFTAGSINIMYEG